MNEPLFVVADRFEAPHGLLLTPGLGTLDDRFQIGAPIVISRPDGSRLERPVYTCDWVHGPKPGINPFLVLTDRQITDVPIGSEVWAAPAPKAIESGG